MRHVGFGAVLVLALVIAMPAALVWAMSECQLHDDPNAVETCFEGAGRDRIVWSVTVAGALAASVALHIRRSRWKWGALGALAVGPWLTMYL